MIWYDYDNERVCLIDTRSPVTTFEILRLWLFLDFSKLLYCKFKKVGSESGYIHGRMYLIYSIELADIRYRLNSFNLDAHSL